VGSRRLYSILIITTLALSWEACSPTKKVREGEYLLVKNEVIDRNAGILDLKAEIDKDEIESYVRQKPNRKVLTFRLHLSLYNRVNEDKLRKKKTRRDKRYDRVDERRIKKVLKKNERRQKKGKTMKEVKKKNKNKRTFREWVMDVGEAPVIYDSILTAKSAKQIRLYLQNKGYFHAEVKDSVVYKKKKAFVYYLVNAKKPYKIKEVTYSIADEKVRQFVLNDSTNCLFKKGEKYDVDKITSERERIAKLLKNNGYYYFAKEYIFYEIDSSFQNNHIAINILVKSQELPVDNYPDSTVMTEHRRYLVREIYIITDFNPKMKGPSLNADTTVSHGIYVISNFKPRYRSHILADAIMIPGHEYYKSERTEATYARLAELKSFKFVSIAFKDAGNDSLDCFVYLTPIVKQSFTLETEGTNTGGNLGVSGSFVYQNRNTFKGAEVFEFKIKGGLEIQQEDNITDPNTTITGTLPFNTLEFGPELSLTIPRFLLPFELEFSKRANPRTTFSLGVNFEQRPSYSRTSAIGSFGYNWKGSPAIRHAFYPAELNLISLDPNPEFEAYLASSTDPFIIYRYTNHFTVGSRYNFTYSNQGLTRKRRFWYFRGSLESAGTLLRNICNLVESAGTDLPEVNGGYLIGGTRFSHYLKVDADIRYYRKFSEHNTLVLRGFSTVGKPLHNLRELPFEKSAFSGGPNSVRAWKSRTIGPGSYYKEDASTFDHVADNQMEFNLEYRFNIIKILNAALFVDAGNIWMRRPFVGLPGVDFNFKRFYKELAVGGGLGLRLDFSFFIIRLDMGIKMHDPIFAEGERWIIQNLFDSEWKKNWTPSNDLLHTNKYGFYNFNFGIGYPF